MTLQSEKTQGEIQRLQDLLEQFYVVCAKQAETVAQRRAHLQSTFDHAEQQEFTDHLHEQVRDCDQMIGETEEQIAELHGQITDVDAALEAR